jgi:hypothetical protein
MANLVMTDLGEKKHCSTIPIHLILRQHDSVVPTLEVEKISLQL